MAKPLSPKSILIREAIEKNPDLKNKEIAELLNGSEDRKKDKIEVTANDIAQQKQAMKKAEAPKTAAEASAGPATAKRGRPKGSPKKTAAATKPAASASPVDLIDGVLSLARQSGGMEQLKRLVDRLAEMGR